MSSEQLAFASNDPVFSGLLVDPETVVIANMTLQLTASYQGKTITPVVGAANTSVKSKDTTVDLTQLGASFTVELSKVSGGLQLEASPASGNAIIVAFAPGSTELKNLIVNQSTALVIEEDVTVAKLTVRGNSTVALGNGSGTDPVEALSNTGGNTVDSVDVNASNVAVDWLGGVNISVTLSGGALNTLKSEQSTLNALLIAEGGQVTKLDLGSARLKLQYLDEPGSVRQTQSGYGLTGVSNKLRHLRLEGFVGGSGADVAYINRGPSEVRLGGGNDTATVKANDSKIYGGAGDDTVILGGNTGIEIFEGTDGGQDTLNLKNRSDSLDVTVELGTPRVVITTQGATSTLVASASNVEVINAPVSMAHHYIIPSFSWTGSNGARSITLGDVDNLELSHLDLSAVMHKLDFILDANGEITVTAKNPNNKNETVEIHAYGVKTLSLGLAENHVTVKSERALAGRILAPTSGALSSHSTTLDYSRLDEVNDANSVSVKFVTTDSVRNAKVLIRETTQTGLVPKGFHDDGVASRSNTYKAQVRVDAGNWQNIEVVIGDWHQRFSQLLVQLNRDTSGATWSVENGILTVKSDSSELSASVELRDAVSGKKLFASLRPARVDYGSLQYTGYNHYRGHAFTGFVGTPQEINIHVSDAATGALNYATGLNYKTPLVKESMKFNGVAVANDRAFHFILGDKQSKSVSYSESSIDGATLNVEGSVIDTSTTPFITGDSLYVVVDDVRHAFTYASSNGNGSWTPVSSNGGLTIVDAGQSKVAIQDSSGTQKQAKSAYFANDEIRTLAAVEFEDDLQLALNIMTAGTPPVSVELLGSVLKVTSQKPFDSGNPLANLAFISDGHNYSHLHTSSSVLTNSKNNAIANGQANNLVIKRIIGADGRDLISEAAPGFTYSIGSFFDDDGQLLHNIGAERTLQLGADKGIIGASFSGGDVYARGAGSVGGIDLSNAIGGLVVFGNEEAENIKLGSGDDVVFAGAGDDEVYGGRGSDTYSFEGSWGHDRISEEGPQANGRFNPLDPKDNDVEDASTGSLGDHVDYHQIGEGMVHVISENNYIGATGAISSSLQAGQNALTGSTKSSGTILTESDWNAAGASDVAAHIVSNPANSVLVNQQQFQYIDRITASQGANTFIFGNDWGPSAGALNDLIEAAAGTIGSGLAALVNTDRTLTIDTSSVSTDSALVIDFRNVSKALKFAFAKESDGSTSLTVTQPGNVGLSFIKELPIIGDGANERSALKFTNLDANATIFAGRNHNTFVIKNGVDFAGSLIGGEGLTVGMPSGFFTEHQIAGDGNKWWADIESTQLHSGNYTVGFSGEGGQTKEVAYAGDLQAFIASVTTTVNSMESGASAFDAGGQSIAFSSKIDASSVTGLAVGTNYSATLSVGTAAAQNITIAGAEAQTFGALITKLTDVTENVDWQIIGGKLVAIVEQGSAGASISIEDTGTNKLFASLTNYSTISAARFIGVSGFKDSALGFKLLLEPKKSVFSTASSGFSSLADYYNLFDDISHGKLPAITVSNQLVYKNDLTAPSSNFNFRNYSSLREINRDSGYPHTVTGESTSWTIALGDLNVNDTFQVGFRKPLTAFPAGVDLRQSAETLKSVTYVGDIAAFRAAIQAKLREAGYSAATVTSGASDTQILITNAADRADNNQLLFQKDTSNFASVVTSKASDGSWDISLEHLVSGKSYQVGFHNGSSHLDELGVVTYTGDKDAFARAVKAALRNLLSDTVEVVLASGAGAQGSMLNVTNFVDKAEGSYVIFQEDTTAFNHTVSSGNGEWSIVLDNDALTDGAIFEVGYERQVSLAGHYYTISSAVKQVTYSAAEGLTKLASDLQVQLRAIHGSSVEVQLFENLLTVKNFVDSSYGKKLVFQSPGSQKLNGFGHIENIDQVTFGYGGTIAIGSNWGIDVGWDSFKADPLGALSQGIDTGSDTFSIAGNVIADALALADKKLFGENNALDRGVSYVDGVLNAAMGDYLGGTFAPSANIFAGLSGGDTYKFSGFFGAAAVLETPDILVGGVALPEGYDTLDLSGTGSDTSIDIYDLATLGGDEKSVLWDVLNLSLIHI